MQKFWFFPFDKIPNGSKIVLYGAGNVAGQYLMQLGVLDYCQVLSVVDKRFKSINSICGIKIYEPKTILNMEYDFIVIAAKNEFFKSISTDLKNLGVEQSKIVFSERGISVYELVKNSHNIFGGFSFSQHGEDMTVLNIFLALGIERPSYLDVGAYHPYDISNTALMYKRGCRGINVEANPNLIDLFIQERPEDINLNLGVSAKSGENLTFYMIEDFSGLNSFSLEFLEYAIKKHPEFQIRETKTIRCVSLMDIVNQYSNGIFPDYLDIDIEGFDYEVLKSCDFSCGKPLVIAAENRSDTDMTIMLNEKGYVEYYRMLANMIYVRKELLPKILR